MSERYNNISAAILAGGRSSRMGSPKYFLKVKGKRIIDATLSTLRSLFDEILIVTDDRKRFSEFKDVTAVDDLIKGCGPLGGIYTGLKYSSKEKVFFMACDMPFLHIGLINRLVEASDSNSPDCIIATSDRGVEPLCGIYSKRMLESLEKVLNEESFSVHSFLQRQKCKYVKVNKDELAALANINTPEELKEINGYENKI